MNMTWILVADAARARLLSAVDDEPAVEIAAFTQPGSRIAGHDLDADRPSRTHDRLGAARHAIEPRTPARDVEAGRFAKFLCLRLQEALDQGEFERLVLMAPPRFLGHLHAAMGKRLRAAIVAETGKDLVSETHAQVAARIREVIAPPQ